MSSFTLELLLLVDYTVSATGLLPTCGLSCCLYFCPLKFTWMDWSYHIVTSYRALWTKKDFEKGSGLFIPLYMAAYWNIIIVGHVRFLSCKEKNLVCRDRGKPSKNKKALFPSNSLKTCTLVFKLHHCLKVNRIQIRLWSQNVSICSLSYYYIHNFL